MENKSKYNSDPVVKHKDTIHCPNCGATDIIRDSKRGELICQECGMVIADHQIEYKPTWRLFSHQKDGPQRRVGPPTDLTRSDKGLSTTMGWRDHDASGKPLSPRSRAEIYRLRKLQQRTRMHSNYHRNLAKAMFELDRLVSQLDLPDSVKETAAVLYRQVLREQITHGRIIVGVIGACVYLACRTHQIPRTLKEIAEISRVTVKDIGRNARHISQELNLYISPIKPTSFIPRFAEALDLNSGIRQHAIQLLTTAKEDLITIGKAPNGLAGAALYIASILKGDPRTQKEIADVAGVTVVTIRARYRELLDELGISL